MKKLYLVRHGETLFNVEHRMQGWSDSPLTDKGILQAQRIGEKLNAKKFDYAYSSTSERACDTAELVLKNRINYTRVKGLKEFNFGLYEAQPEILQPQSLDVYENFFVPFGGETLTNNGKRMLTTLIRIMNEPEHNLVLAVSHGWSILNFLKTIGDATEAFENGIPNAAILTFTFSNDTFTLENIDRSISKI